MKHPTLYRTIQIDGLSLFYREAGPKGAPTLLLLHGFPSSSRMFEPFFARLADRYHLIAPDYPGFGHSDWPDPRHFAYAFDHIAEIMQHFTEALGLARYTLYMHDYGGAVGFRMVLVHPDRIEALIVQNAVAHDEALGANWKVRRAFWADRAANESSLRINLLSLPTTRTRHVGNDPNVERYNPDLWTDEFAFLKEPGQGDIQSDLFYDLGGRIPGVVDTDEQGPQSSPTDHEQRRRRITLEQDHSGYVLRVVPCANERIIVSCSTDRTLRLWDSPVHSLRRDRPYERMVMDFSAAQRDSTLALGAVER
jgi:pimeloyl-ACP methyl ester carboxylesterase